MVRNLLSQSEQIRLREVVEFQGLPGLEKELLEKGFRLVCGGGNGTSAEYQYETDAREIPSPFKDGAKIRLVFELRFRLVETEGRAWKLTSVVMGRKETHLDEAE